MLKQIDHVNIVVRDLPAMTAFYRDVLGLKITKQAVISGEWIDAVVGLKGVLADVVYLELPAGPRIELIYYQRPAGASPVGLDLPNTRGLRHLAFTVDDLDVALERLKTQGIAVPDQIETVPDSQVQYAGAVRKRLIYFRDPEDNLLELCEYRVRPSRA